MKRFIALLALIVPLYTYAGTWFQYEAGIGVSRYTAGPDGEWYQQGMSHDLRLNAPAWRAGVQMNVSEPDGVAPGVRLHLAYLNLGHEGMSSVAAPDKDAYYGAHGGYYDLHTQHCSGACQDVRDFNSGGRMQVVALTVEPFWNVGHGVQFGVEAGPAMFHVQWSASATNPADTTFWGPQGAVEAWSAKSHWEPGALVGASLSRGAWALRYNYVFARQHNFAGTSSSIGATYAPAGWRGVHVVTLNYVY